MTFAEAVRQSVSPTRFAAVFGAVCAFGLAWAGSAEAVAVDVENGTMKIEGHDGVDDVTVRFRAEYVVVQAHGATPLFGSGCMPGGVDEVLCPRASIERLVAELLDGADRLRLLAALIGSAHMGAGNDVFIGGPSRQTVFGGAGMDRQYGGGGNDRLLGQGGPDRIFGGIGADGLFGGPGNDRMFGQGGPDSMFGAAGGDWMYGGPSGDRIYGGRGPDWLYGQRGNDWLFGQQGNDRTYGGPGRDRGNGGPGFDLPKTIF